MRICILTHRYPPALGGSEKVCYNLAHEFKKKGHKVTVVTTTSMNHLDTRGFSTGRGFTLKSTNHDSYAEKHDWIPVYRFKPDFQFWPFALNKNMADFFKKNKTRFDIVHVHGYQAYEAVLVSKLDIPYVLTAHDVIAHYGGILGLIKKIFDVFFGKKILKKAKALIALTPENKFQYLDIDNRCENKVRTIPNGIEKPKKLSDEKRKDLLAFLGNPEKIILYTGRIVEYKGCQYVIRALPEIIRQYPMTKFVVVGPDQGYAAELKDLARELGVYENCIFTGVVDSVSGYYNIADAFVLASRGEGFGLSAVEAMSLGVPCVLADMGGLKYVLKDIGGHPINMQEDIVSQIKKYVLSIFSDAEVKGKMKYIVEKTKDYRWDRIAEKHLDIFEKILRN